MAVHIGQIINELVKERGLKAKYVAREVHVSESTLYKIYQRKIVDIPKLISFSILLRKNLFAYYMDEGTFNHVFNSELGTLQRELESLKEDNRQQIRRMVELEETIATQKKLIQLMERQLVGKKGS